jgi:hypothetical protein
MHAGNRDNTELVAGTTLFIPVFAEGALFEVGDGHAGQGNGEVDITALETFLRAPSHSPYTKTNTCFGHGLRHRRITSASGSTKIEKRDGDGGAKHD